MNKTNIVILSLISFLALLLISFQVTDVSAKKINGKQKSEKIKGTAKKDKINARGGKDVVVSKKGNDRINGGKGNDKLSGGSGQDRIFGAKGKDKVKGQKGKDKLKGGVGRDKLVGGKGKDFLLGQKGNDLFYGNKGQDRLRSADSLVDNVINGGNGEDRCVVDTALELQNVVNCETIIDGGQAEAPQGELLPTEIRGITGCEENLVPVCNFAIEGTGADDLLGLQVSGDNGLLLGGLEISVLPNGRFLAVGGYACTGENGQILLSSGNANSIIPIKCVSID